MSTIRKFLAIAIFTPCLFAPVAAHSKQVLKMRTDEWCPIACAPGPRPGLFIEVLQNALDPKQFEIDYQLINFARAISDARDGKTEGVVGLAVSDAPDLIFHKEPISAVSYEFFALKDKNWKYKGSFDGTKIGVINSYTYDDTITKLIEAKDPHFVVVSGNDAQEQLIRMLNAGRIDAFYESAEVFRETVLKMKLNPDNYKSAGAPAQTPQKLFVAFSPKLQNAKQLAAMVDQGLKKMRKNGQYKKLIEKYGVKDWKSR